MAPCEGIEKHHGTCPEGKIPSLSPTNREFWAVFSLAMPGLIRQGNGMGGPGGYDYGALTAVFRAMGVSRHRQAFYMPRAAAVIGVIQRMREKNG